MRDGVALLDEQGRIQYANPALLRMFGRQPDLLLAQALADLDIDGNAATGTAAGRVPGAGPVECHVRDAAGRQLILWLTRAVARLPGQQLQVLMLQDITELRRLEQQIHSVTSVELGRQGSAVHEGIAQDLTGISLLLRTVAGRTSADTAQLQSISAHVSRVIAHARALARGLSPVQAAGGSLSDALSHCAQDLSAKRGIDVVARAQLDDLTLGTVQADQLYRIASEALRWVAGAAGCSRIELELRPVDRDLRLEIRGDGRASAAATAGAVLPDLIAYLTRLLRGRVERTAPAGSGRGLEVTVSLQSLAGESGPGPLSPASSDHAAAQISPVPPLN
jgi:signal transduction histidine kinase